MAEFESVQNSNKVLIISGVIILVVAIGLITNGFGLFSLLNPTGRAVGGVDNPLLLTIGKSPVIGNLDAPLTIYEFSDFSCSACISFASQTMPKIEETYIKTGKVKIVFKYFPGHGTAQPAHIVSLAMNDQGLFEEFHTAAFSAPAEDKSSLDKMKSLAVSLGANSDALEKSISEIDYLSQLQLETKMARENGVRGTPSFFINGQFIEGASSFEDFSKIIDKQLSNL